MIRPMTMDDVQDIAAMEKECFQEPWTQEGIAAELTLNPFSRPYVLEVEGKLAGYMMVWITFEQAQLANIAVSPALRNRGLGKTLLEFALEKAREEGCEWMSLEVRESNASARRLYEQAGFAYLSRAEKYYGNEDGWRMGRAV